MVARTAVIREERKSRSAQPKTEDWPASEQLASNTSVVLENRDLSDRAILSREIPATGLSAGHRITKRVFDIVGAISIAVLVAPVILGVAIKIRLSGTPVIFSHMRVGRGRKMFPCYKFRSMVPDAEAVLQDLLRSSPETLREWRENHKLKNDPRVTKFGKFLRESSLDELPQL